MSRAWAWDDSQQTHLIRRLIKENKFLKNIPTTIRIYLSGYFTVHQTRISFPRCYWKRLKIFTPPLLSTQGIIRFLEHVLLSVLSCSPFLKIETNAQFKSTKRLPWPRRYDHHILYRKFEFNIDYTQMYLTKQPLL